MQFTQPDSRFSPRQIVSILFAAAAVLLVAAAPARAEILVKDGQTVGFMAKFDQRVEAMLKH